MISLQLMFAQFDCNGEELDYHPEPARGPLKFGDTGDRVKALQTALTPRGYFEERGEPGSDEIEFAADGIATGIYGPLTIRAVMNFQYTVGIYPNGIAGPSTFAALELLYP
jgi:peptidoglycan hydrolase-like protein with peptidoglycan-binding domain